MTEEAIRLRLFPFSLRDQARAWLNSLPPGSITTWNDLAEKFWMKYCPPTKTAKLRNDITAFRQIEGESLYEAWERFKEFLRKCLHHGIPYLIQMETFYNGLSGHTRTLVDAAVGGALMAKSYNEAYELLKRMANNNYQWLTERATATRRVVRAYKLDAISTLSVQVATLSKKLDSVNLNTVGVHSIQASSVSCAFCGAGHTYDMCPSNLESAFFVGNYRNQNNTYSNTYNPRWRNHPKFSWNNN